MPTRKSPLSTPKAPATETPAKRRPGRPKTLESWKPLNERMADYRQRNAEAGVVELMVRVPLATVAQLDEICASRKSKRAIEVERLVGREHARRVKAARSET